MTCSFGPRPPAAAFARDLGVGWFAVLPGGAAPPAGALALEPVAASGTWDGRAVLGALHGPTTGLAPLAVLTRTAPADRHRADVEAATAALAADLAAGVPGLRWWRLLDDGGVPCTLSMWDGAAEASAWAWAGRHGDVVRRSRDEGWLAEGLFARFAVAGPARQFGTGAPRSNGDLVVPAARSRRSAGTHGSSIPYGSPPNRWWMRWASARRSSTAHRARSAGRRRWT